jgi:hypothetical protein
MNKVLTERAFGLEKKGGPLETKNHSSVFQSILLLFFSYTLAFIMSLAIHELGHATVDLIHGATITRFVVHPFFASYVISGCA